MQWVIDHFDTLFVIAVAILAILQKLGRASGGTKGAKPRAEDPEQAERTRRIQAEIRRRIMERRGLAPMASPEPATSAPEPEYAETPPVIAEPSRPAEPPTREPSYAAPSGWDREMERQQQLVRQLAEVSAAGAMGGGGGDSTMRILAEIPRAPGPDERLRAELRQTAGLRRAVVLREILGPPVSMR